MSKNYHRHEIRCVETNRNGLVCYSTFKFYTGRIKRMRSRRESRYVNLAKRVGKRAYSFNFDFCSNLTRWNRH